MEKSETSYDARGMQGGRATVENSLEFPQNVKRRIPIGRSSYVPRYKPKRNVRPHKNQDTDSSVIHDGQKEQRQ